MGRNGEQNVDNIDTLKLNRQERFKSLVIHFIHTTSLLAELRKDKDQPVQVKSQKQKTRPPKPRRRRRRWKVK